jgi:bla regulator protein blaR1
VKRVRAKSQTEARIGTPAKVIASIAKAPTRKWLLMVFLGGVFELVPFNLLGQKSTVPVPGPLPLEQSEGQAEKFEFEVASVRLNEKWKFADPGYSLDSDDNYVPGQSLFVADAPLSTFIAFAYKLDLLNSMIANLPKWANEQSYEIRARVPGTPSKDQVRLMMRALLIERFQLAIHFEKQERPALALTLVKPGKLGPGLHLHDEVAGCKVSGTPPNPGGPIAGLDWLPCNTYLALDRPEGAIFAGARNTTMRQLCAFLSNVGGYGRIVVDQSGIAGAIDFGMECTKPKPDADIEHAGSPVETFQEALRDQLGVKLTPLKALVDIPIVDHVSAPKEN